MPHLHAGAGVTDQDVRRPYLQLEGRFICELNFSLY